MQQKALRRLRNLTSAYIYDLLVTECSSQGLWFLQVTLFNSKLNGSRAEPLRRWVETLEHWEHLVFKTVWAAPVLHPAALPALKTMVCGPAAAEIILLGRAIRDFSVSGFQSKQTLRDVIPLIDTVFSLSLHQAIVQTAFGLMRRYLPEIRCIEVQILDNTVS